MYYYYHFTTHRVNNKKLTLLQYFNEIKNIFESFSFLFLFIKFKFKIRKPRGLIVGLLQIILYIIMKNDNNNINKKNI